MVRLHDRAFQLARDRTRMLWVIINSLRLVYVKSDAEINLLNCTNRMSKKVKHQFRFFAPDNLEELSILAGGSYPSWTVLVFDPFVSQESINLFNAFHPDVVTRNVTDLNYQKDWSTDLSLQTDSSTCNVTDLSFKTDWLDCMIEPYSPADHFYKFSFQCARVRVRHVEYLRLRDRREYLRRKIAACHIMHVKTDIELFALMRMMLGHDKHIKVRGKGTVPEKEAIKDLRFKAGTLYVGPDVSVPLINEYKELHPRVTIVHEGEAGEDEGEAGEA